MNNVFEHYDAVMRLRACADIYETKSLYIQGLWFYQVELNPCLHLQANAIDVL